MTYDEFGMFRENAEEAGLAWTGPPAVTRREVNAPQGRISALVWGTAPAEIVLLHGGAQNAHTWDTVALALGRPLVAIDLPGHGHSDWWDSHHYPPSEMADSVSVAVSQLAPQARLVVGMSLGGMTAFCLAAQHPHLVPRLAIVDVTPGTDHAKAEPIIAFISGPEVFADFDAILARTIEYNPTRLESSLRRGVLHNARPQEDGTWVWRYDRFPRPERDPGAPPLLDGLGFEHLWDAVESINVPLLLIRGGLSGVVGDEDVAELLRRQPRAEVLTVEGAGHSIQGDKPVELAAILERFLEES